MDLKLIKEVFKLADKSLKQNEFPVGAIIFDDSGIISRGYNCRNKTKRTTGHAEIMAIEKANKILNEWRLEDKSMLVTLEPCDMCKSVLKEARLKKIYYIIPRYNYKKQFKHSIFENVKIDSNLVEKYYDNITNFFSDKH